MARTQDYNSNSNTTHFQDVPQSLCKQLVKSHTRPLTVLDVHYCSLNVLVCHLHSELEDVACTITTQQAPAESAQELCSALESNCETYTHSGNPAGRSHLEKVTWGFSTRVPRLPN